MGMFNLFLLNVALFSAFPFYFAIQKNPLRATSFYVYIGILLTLGSLLGPLLFYNLDIPLIGAVTFSAGSIVYAAFMMNIILLVVTERNVESVRNVVRLIIFVALLKYPLFQLLSWALQDAQALNSFNVPPALFDTALSVVVIGGMLNVMESVVLIYIFEAIKKFIQNTLFLSIAYLLTFTFILCLDGILFPLFFSSFSPEFLTQVAGNIKGKFVLALAFSVPMFLFFLVFRNQLSQFANVSLDLRYLLSLSKQKLVEEIWRQKESVELNKEELRNVAQRLSVSNEAAGVAIWDANLIDHSFICDDKMHELYGVVREEIGISQEAWAVPLHPDDRERIFRAWNIAIQDKQPYHVKFRIIRPDKQVRHIESHAVVRLDAQGNAIRMIGANRDVTEQAELESKNISLQEQFYQAQKMESIGLMAGGIAHDFNNLLVPIIGYAELNLTDLSHDDPLYDDFAQIKKSADRAAELTRKILAFSRQQMLEISTIDLNQLIQDFEVILQRLLGDNINVITKLEANLDFINGDTGQLEQVILNLAINSRDAMPDGGSLSITTRSSEHAPDTIIMTVADTGTGIDEETQERIFEPFFTTKSREQGTGLGLASVFGIVKQHQGNIQVYSAAGKGTRFEISFPKAPGTASANIKQADAHRVHKDEEQKSISPGGNETILVTEDDDGVRKLVCDSLQKHGYQVLEAGHPEEALNLVHCTSAPIHLLLTDVIMPGMNGVELFQALHPERPNMRVLYMSGYAEEPGSNLIHLASEQNYLQKPFSTHDLLKKLRVMLDDQINKAS